MKKEGSSPETIGLMGAGAGCGVTHLTILFANYLAAVEHKRVLVLDRSGTSAYERIGALCVGAAWEREELFSVFGVDYHPNAAADSMARSLWMDYEVILLDLGRTAEEKKAEYLQCSCSMYLAALNEWAFQEFREQISWMQNGTGNWIFLSAFGGREAREEVKRRLHLDFLWVPYEPDAFSPGPETITFFQRLRSMKF